MARASSPIFVMLVVIVAVTVQAGTLHYTVNFVGNNAYGPTGSLAFNTATENGIMTVFYMGNTYPSVTPETSTFDLSPVFFNFTPPGNCVGATDQRTVLNMLTGCDPNLSATWTALETQGDDYILINIAQGNQGDWCQTLPVFTWMNNPSASCAQLTTGAADPVMSFIFGSGPLTLTQETPEPSTGILCIVGILSGAVTRRRH